jgi:hypothetical protein
MDKKGSSIVLMIFEIIIVVFVVYTTFQIAQAYASSDTSNKINLANDLKMMVDTLVGVPGDAMVEYPGDVSRYTFILTPTAVTVFVLGEGERGAVTRDLNLPNSFSAFGDLSQQERLCLKKEQKRIELLSC